MRLKQVCLEEVHRVMHERASYVDLHPEIELACMSELARLCSDKTGPGEEISCLQENYEDLAERCVSVVKNYTEAEAKVSYQLFFNHFQFSFVDFYHVLYRQT